MFVTWEFVFPDAKANQYFTSRRKQNKQKTKAKWLLAIYYLDFPHVESSRQETVEMGNHVSRRTDVTVNKTHRFSTVLASKPSGSVPVSETVPTAVAASLFLLSGLGTRWGG